VYVIFFFFRVYHSKICYFVYVLLFSIARNIVLVVLIISHGYSLPLSKLFCLKGSLNLKERWSNFLEVLGRVVRSEWFTPY